MRFLAAAIGDEAMTCHGDIKTRDINTTTWDINDIKRKINNIEWEDNTINREVNNTDRKVNTKWETNDINRKIEDTDRNSIDTRWESNTINREINHTDSPNKMKFSDNTQLTADNADNRVITDQTVVDREIGDDNDGGKTTHTDNSDWEDTDQKMGRKGTMEKSGMDLTSTRKVTTNIADMRGEMHNRMLDNYDYEREITNQIVVD